MEARPLTPFLKMASTTSEDTARSRTLDKLDEPTSHVYTAPLKKIHDGPDVSFFLSSFAYRDIMTFLLQLNHAMIPKKSVVDDKEPYTELVDRISRR